MWSFLLCLAPAITRIGTRSACHPNVQVTLVGANEAYSTSRLSDFALAEKRAKDLAFFYAQEGLENYLKPKPEIRRKNHRNFAVFFTMLGEQLSVH